jgi:hypothetical protein
MTITNIITDTKMDKVKKKKKTLTIKIWDCVCRAFL